MRWLIYVLLVFCLSNQSWAQWEFDNSGSRIFDMRSNSQQTMRITLESVAASEVKGACDRKSKALGYGGFSYEAIACAFWKGKTCHIILPHKVDMRTIGHEVMHCFQGDWHKQPSK